MPIAVQVPKTPTQLDEVRALMRSFIAWHKERHREDIHLINAYFGDAGFEEELASLPGKYGPPRGQLLLATLDDAPAGCVALPEIDSGSCEMKRMFVYTQHHGKGVGRALAEAIIKEARALGYRAMRLDTRFARTRPTDFTDGWASTPLSLTMNFRRMYGAGSFSWS